MRSFGTPIFSPRALLALLVLVILALASAPRPAAAVLPNNNPSTSTRAIPPPYRSFIQKTLIFTSSGDTARLAFGFEAEQVDMWTYSKGIFAQYGGAETFLPAASREGLRAGVRQGSPVFECDEFWFPANTSDSITPGGCWGVRLRSVLNADTVVVRAYRRPESK